MLDLSIIALTLTGYDKLLNTCIDGLVLGVTLDFICCNLEQLFVPWLLDPSFARYYCLSNDKHIMEVNP